MSALTLGKTAGYSFFLYVLFLSITPALQQSANAVALEIVSKRYSAGYFPVVGSYVEYEARLTNTGGRMIESQSLYVSLVSAGNGTHSVASYSVPQLDFGESETLHLGPFRIDDEGEHRLLAEIDSVSLSYTPDFFIVYSEKTIHVALIAILLIASGAGAVGFSLYSKRRAV